MNKAVESIFTTNNDYVTCTHLLVNEYGKFDALSKTLNYKLNNALNKQKAYLVDATLEGLHRLCHT